MRKDVIELFAGVGGFRVGLNDIHEILTYMKDIHGHQELQTMNLMKMVLQ